MEALNFAALNEPDAIGDKLAGIFNPVIREFAKKAVESLVAGFVAKQDDMRDMLAGQAGNQAAIKLPVNFSAVLNTGRNTVKSKLRFAEPFVWQATEAMPDPNQGELFES